MATDSSDDVSRITSHIPDAVDLSIMWDRLISIADEIVSTLVRTSFSTIVSESYDLTVAILDRHGHLMAQGTYSVPVFMGTAPHTLRQFLQRFPPQTLKPDDVLISNDPWIGTGHMFDINVMRPVRRSSSSSSRFISSKPPSPVVNALMMPCASLLSIESVAARLEAPCPYIDPYSTVFARSRVMPMASALRWWMSSPLVTS